MPESKNILAAVLLSGIGPVYAKRIVKKFKEDTIRIIDEEPDRLLEAEGIGPKRLEMIKRPGRIKRNKNVMLFLQSEGFHLPMQLKYIKLMEMRA